MCIYLPIHVHLGQKGDAGLWCNRSAGKGVAPVKPPNWVRSAKKNFPSVHADSTWTNKHKTRPSTHSHWTNNLHCCNCTSISPNCNTMTSYRSLWMARRNFIHIHCRRLKWNEGAFNNHGYMVFKESWDTGKRRIENERLQRLLACTPTSGHMTSRHTPTHTFARKLCCIYIWMPICKRFVRNSPYATILSSNFRFTSINEFNSPGSMVLVCVWD